LTKHIARLLVAGAAVAAVALPAAPAQACNATFLRQCVENLVTQPSPTPICQEVSGTLAPICVG
jgi:hypothetical protein